ncbi:hypothetical protein HMPREF0742_02423 [Rothia aeria F0184]|uniref:Uncharacterized protein n=1 Tax=Rothia aeria F0184 TaxID=888019 RepID=U7V011_9MICC|nr:hypothetical protein HMPREF0742_02423 [Rothia aeria F0184]
MHRKKLNLQQLHRKKLVANAQFCHQICKKDRTMHLSEKPFFGYEPIS